VVQRKEKPGSEFYNPSRNRRWDKQGRTSIKAVGTFVPELGGEEAWTCAANIIQKSSRPSEGHETKGGEILL